MELCPNLTIKIYTSFQNLYVAINIDVLKKDYAITTKYFRENQKEGL